MIPLVALSFLLLISTRESTAIMNDNITLSSNQSVALSTNQTGAQNAQSHYQYHHTIPTKKNSDIRSQKYERVIQKILYGMWCGFLARIALGIFEDSAIDPATKLYLAGFFGVLSGTIYE